MRTRFPKIHLGAISGQAGVFDLYQVLIWGNGDLNSSFQGGRRIFSSIILYCQAWKFKITISEGIAIALSAHETSEPTALGSVSSIVKHREKVISSQSALAAGWESVNLVRLCKQSVTLFCAVLVNATGKKMIFSTDFFYHHSEWHPAISEQAVQLNWQFLAKSSIFSSPSVPQVDYCGI